MISFLQQKQREKLKGEGNCESHDCESETCASLVLANNKKKSSIIFTFFWSNIFIGFYESFSLFLGFYVFLALIKS